MKELREPPIFSSLARPILGIGLGIVIFSLCVLGIVLQERGVPVVLVSASIVGAHFILRIVRWTNRRDDARRAEDSAMPSNRS